MKNSRNKIYILSLVVFLLISPIVAYSIGEDTTMSKISVNTELTAQHTKKGCYEYFAIAFSFLAMAFGIATYISQRKTQKNTQPIFTKKNQLETMCDIADKLLENYVKSIAIRIKLLESIDGKYVAPVNLVSQMISSDGIHLELFYSDIRKKISIPDIDEKSIYGNIARIKEEIEHYNKNLDIIAKELSDPTVDIDYKVFLFDSKVLSKPLEILILIKEFIDDVYRNDCDLRKRINKKVMFMKDILICTDVDAEKRLTEEELKEEYIELINEVLDDNLYLWINFFENEKKVSGSDELKAFLMNISIWVLYYLSDKNDKFKILMRSYNN